MNGWTTFAAALAGAGLGGSATLTAGLLADLRRRRSDRQQRVIELIAIVLTNATMIQTVIGEYQQKRQKELTDNTALRAQQKLGNFLDLQTSNVADLDRDKLHDHLFQLVQSGAELDWLAMHSPLREPLKKLEDDISKLVAGWDLWSAAYEERRKTVEGQVRVIDAKVVEFSHYTPAKSAEYLLRNWPPDGKKWHCYWRLPHER